MNVNKSQRKQQQHTKKKKFNKNQHNRKAQRFKKKHRRIPMQTKKVSDNYSIQLPYTLPNIQFKNLSVSQQSPMKKTSNPSDITTSTDPTLLLTDFLTISNIKFKEMLLASTSDDINKDALNELLNKEDIFLYIRQLTQLVNKLNYSKLQHEQWPYYHHLGNTEGIWNGRVSKNMADANSMCQTYGRSKMLIQQRQQKYKQQFEQNQNDMNEHMKQAPALIDMTQVMNIINKLTHQDQYHLRIELQRRKTLLQFDAKEHQLVHGFYQLKPRKTTIHSAKLIWKAIHDEQAIRYEMAMFKKRLPFLILPTSYTLQDLQLPNINHIFTQLVFQTQQTSTYQLGVQTLAKAEELAQTYAQKAIQEKNKLLQTRSNHKNTSLFDKIMITIVDRENNMIQRAQHDIQQKLLMAFNQIKSPLMEN